jgi:hypothetical protein
LGFQLARFQRSVFSALHAKNAGDRIAGVSGFISKDGEADPTGSAPHLVKK